MRISSNFQYLQFFLKFQAPLGLLNEENISKIAKLQKSTILTNIDKKLMINNYYTTDLLALSFCHITRINPGSAITVFAPQKVGSPVPLKNFAGAAEKSFYNSTENSHQTTSS